MNAPFERLQLTAGHRGRDYRLADVYGEGVQEIIASPQTSPAHS